MQTKYKLPKDIYSSVLWIIRGQARREMEYNEKYSDILNGGGAKYIRICSEDKDWKKEEWAYMTNSHNGNQSTTEIKSMALLSLEQNPETEKMRAVQQVLINIGTDISNPELRRELQASILNNINNRRDYNYNRLNLPGISRDKFFSYKSKFIFDVAKRINFI